MTDLLTTIDEQLLGALARRGFTPRRVATAAEARDLVLAELPDDALVAHGGSTTLQQIGVVEALRNSSRVRYGNALWMAEDDPEKRLALRKELCISADVFLGSVQAVTRTGQVLGADQSGSRQAFYVYGPRRVIWVVGANKVVAGLDDALARLRNVVVPLEDERVKASGMPGTAANKIVILEAEPIQDRVTIVLVDETLGF